MNAEEQKNLRRIYFEIITPTPLPTGEQVFISGSDPTLGNWKPDGLPLTRVEDRVWKAEAVLPADHSVEYKITRGSWDSEEVLPDGTVPSNYRISAGGDRIVRHTVLAWRDGRYGTET
ncbi:MAG TPA: hypothetical protein ENG36_03325 [Lentisphaerae bacterium]|nr:hypothetical protein [Lentisphaerota bacterium]